jgi:hypothetical protein
VVELPFLSHESDDRVLHAGRIKDIALRVLRVETVGPQTLEINGVYQNQVGLLVNTVGWQEITNVTLRHVADPFIDVILHFCRIRSEIGHLQLIMEEIEHTFA